jgi:hypothetical protein
MACRQNTLFVLFFFFLFKSWRWKLEVNFALSLYSQVFGRNVKILSLFIFSRKLLLKCHNICEWYLLIALVLLRYRIWNIFSFHTSSGAVSCLLGILPLQVAFVPTVARHPSRQWATVRRCHLLASLCHHDPAELVWQWCHNSVRYQQGIATASQVGRKALIMHD